MESFSMILHEIEKQSGSYNRREQRHRAGDCHRTRAREGANVIISYATDKSGAHATMKQIQGAPFPGFGCFKLHDRTNLFVDGGWTVQGKIPAENLDLAAKRNV